MVTPPALGPPSPETPTHLVPPDPATAPPQAVRGARANPHGSGRPAPVAPVSGAGTPSPSPAESLPPGEVSTSPSLPTVHRQRPETTVPDMRAGGPTRSPALVRDRSASKPPPTPAERFGRRVAAARAARGWSMRDLCAKAGVAAPSTIKRCEDDGCVSLSLAVRIAAALGVSMDGLGDDAACWTCGGSPPRGFTCDECGTGGTR